MNKSRSPNLEKYITEENRHNFISYEEGAKLYGMPYWTFVRFAKSAKSTTALRKTAVVDMVILDAFIEDHDIDKNEKKEDEDMPRKRKNALTPEQMEDMILTKNKKYVRYEEGESLYSVGKATFRKWAREAHAIRKINGVVLVNTEMVDRFIEAFEVEEVD